MKDEILLPRNKITIQNGHIVKVKRSNGMKLIFQSKETLRNIALSNRELESGELIQQLSRIFDLTKEQREYVKAVIKLNAHTP